MVVQLFPPDEVAAWGDLETDEIVSSVAPPEREVVGLGYQALLVDPPWKFPTSLPGFGKKEGDVWKRPGSVVPFATMTNREILDLGPLLKAVTAPQCHLYLWSTQYHLPVAFECLKAWGFNWSTMLLWVKKPRGRPGFPTWPNWVEYCLFARRGTLRTLKMHETNVYEFPRARHSQKPPEFRDMFAETSPGPRLELFARPDPEGPRDQPYGLPLGWRYMGLETSGMDVREELELEAEYIREG